MAYKPRRRRWSRKEKGRVAGAIVSAVFNGARLEDLLDDENRKIWREMHSVAHLWLACVDLVAPVKGGKISRPDASPR
jgi:hypothetical protein